MKALTIWQPWASLIIGGWKPYEFRHWAAPTKLVGHRIAIHAGARKIKAAEVADLLLRFRSQNGEGTGMDVSEEVIAFLDRVHLGPGILPLASVIGTAILGEPTRATSLYPDSDRADHHVWGWPLSAIFKFEPPIPARGAQGFWEWNGI